MAVILTRGLLCLFFLTSALEAKDLGIHGHVFRIEEDDLLEWLKNKTQSLSKEEEEAVKIKLQNHFVSQIRNPVVHSHLKEAEVYQVKYMDPTICAEQDILNHLGEVIVRKGTCINPLENIQHLDALLFFDASNAQHLEWAKQQNQLVKWVLTKGQPLEIEEKENQPVYFDQFGFLVDKFGLQHLPAKVSKDGLKLKIEEIPVRRSNA